MGCWEELFKDGSNPLWSRPRTNQITCQSLSGQNLTLVLQNEITQQDISNRQCIYCYNPFQQNPNCKLKICFKWDLIPDFSIYMPPPTTAAHHPFPTPFLTGSTFPGDQSRLTTLCGSVSLAHWEIWLLFKCVDLHVTFWKGDLPSSDTKLWTPIHTQTY